ncbi:uncharacterized protein An07g05590 [Aspergillus niger]|uniref:Contig An07c0150, genomic contig n=2 Tax=Aspergillus niger TaxID=5061 RepID=A2QNG8_ASPNC|nr:uncharacterized protein An07g05590 [Aspergillus niger]CAK39474.1 unnamed protein product [Aspergillus niger]
MLHQIHMTFTSSNATPAGSAFVAAMLARLY